MRARRSADARSVEPFAYPLRVTDTTDLESGRRTWLARARFAHTGRKFPPAFSTHGLLLLIDIEAAFCAGAWLSVIVMSYAVIDATLRHIVTGDYEAKGAELYGNDVDLDWLRKLRNDIVHTSPPGAPSKLWSASATDLVSHHATLESTAQRAVSLVYREISRAR